MIVAVLLSLGAACLHATWNILLKESADPLPMTTRAVVASAAALAPMTLAAWLVTGRPGLPPAAWGLLVISAAAELLYFRNLSRAYQSGDLSTVYPIARGVGALTAVLAGLLLLGERLRAPQLVGVALLLIGLLVARWPSRSGAGLAPALLTGLCIGLYSTLDRVGVRLGPAWLYGGALWLTMALLLILWTKGTPLATVETGRAGWPASLLVGLLMAAAYGLTLAAFTIAPLSVVGPLRESAIVLVAGWGVWRLGERRGAALRLSGAAVIVVGVLLLTAA